MVRTNNSVRTILSLLLLVAFGGLLWGIFRGPKGTTEEINNFVGLTNESAPAIALPPTEVAERVMVVVPQTNVVAVEQADTNAVVEVKPRRISISVRPRLSSGENNNNQ